MSPALSHPRSGGAPRSEAERRWILWSSLGVRWGSGGRVDDAGEGLRHLATVELSLAPSTRPDQAPDNPDSSRVGASLATDRRRPVGKCDVGQAERARRSGPAPASPVRTPRRPPALPTAQNVFGYAVRFGQGITLGRDAGLATTVVSAPVLFTVVALLA